MPETGAPSRGGSSRDLTGPASSMGGRQRERLRGLLCAPSRACAGVLEDLNVDEPLIVRLRRRTQPALPGDVWYEEAEDTEWAVIDVTDGRVRLRGVAGLRQGDLTRRTLSAFVASATLSSSEASRQARRDGEEEVG